jgi:GNAT superfamily N-acetyltransferase
MNHHPMTIIPATIAEIPAIAALILAQQTRQMMRDPRCKDVDVRHQIERALTEDLSNDAHALVTINSKGEVCGYAQPSVWELKETSILSSFLSARNGIIKKLTLPDPLDEDADAVVTALLQAVNAFWREADTSGDLIRWPSKDTWFDSVLTKQGFQLDSFCALSTLQPFFASRPEASSHQHVRTARLDDAETLVELFREELLFHERYSPFVHCSTYVVDAFRQKLRASWKGNGLEEGAPLVIVVEQEGTVIAMAENTLLTVTSDDEPGFTPPGRYWCFDNVSVREDLQGQGIGRLLVQAVEDVIAILHLDLDGYVLWFNPDNPKAARFWTRFGFQPLWTTYQRLHTAEDA